MRAIMRASVAGVLAVAALGVTGAVAEEGTGHFEGEFGLGTGYTFKDRDNAKFREFWYDNKSMFSVAPEGRISWESGNWWLDSELAARSGLQGQSHDGAFEVEGGGLGLFAASVEYRRISHTFAYGARTLFQRNGAADYVVDDAIQRDFESTGYSTTAATQAGYNASVATRLANYMKSAYTTDIGLRRDRVKVNFDLKALEPVSVGVDVNGELRKGTRPIGTGFGFGNALELPEPIDYRTVDVAVRTGWADTLPGLNQHAHFGIRAGLSSFHNANESFTFDSPLRITDSHGTSAYSQSYLLGAARGRHSLAPSNEAVSIGADMGTNLPYHMHLMAAAHRSIATQDAELLPATINPSVNSTTLLSPLPRTTLEGRVVSDRFEVALSARPAPRYHIKAAYGYKSHDNQTERFVVPQAVQIDGAVQGSATPHWVSSIEREVELEQSFEVAERTVVSLMLMHMIATFENGSADRMTENKAVLSADSRLVDWASVRVSGEHAAREAEYQDYTVLELPLMRKYYAASRDRDRVVGMLTVYATENLSLSGERVEQLDLYPESVFGMQEDRSAMTSVSLDYEATDGISFGAYFTNEEIKTHQRGRQWSPNGAGDPYTTSPGTEDPSNWDVDSTDLIRTMGFTSAVAVVPDKVGLQVSAAYSHNDGSVGISSPVGTTPYADANQWYPQSWPQVDEARGLTTGASVRVQATKRIAMVVGYSYDVWKIASFQYDGYTPVSDSLTGTYTGLLSMDTLAKNYEAHTAFVRVSTTF